MPFKEYAPFFKPEELDTLTAAFDATWGELSAANPDLSTEDKIALMKKKLAHRILVSATAGGVPATWRHLRDMSCGASVAVFA